MQNEDIRKEFEEFREKFNIWSFIKKFRVLYFDSLKRLRELKYGREPADQDRSDRLDFLQFSYETQLRSPNKSWSYVKENIRKTLEKMKSYEDDPKRPSIFTTWHLTRPPEHALLAQEKY